MIRATKRKSKGSMNDLHKSVKAKFMRTLGMAKVVTGTWTVVDCLQPMKIRASCPIALFPEKKKIKCGFLDGFPLKVNGPSF